MTIRTPIRSSVWSVAGAALLAGVVLCLGVRRGERIHEEAAVGEAVCAQLVLNTTEGRQALVSSVWWPPLPVLARLPMVVLAGPNAQALASRMVGAACAGALWLLLLAVLKEWHLGWARSLFALAAVLNPFFLEGCLAGSTAPLAVVFATLCGVGLVEWIALRKLRWLVWFAVGCALLVATSPHFAGWVKLLLLLFALDTLVSREGVRQKEAALILGFLPTLYMAGLWVLMNWLIMGDWLYAARSVLAWQAEHGGPLPLLASLLGPGSLRQAMPGAFPFVLCGVLTCLAVLATLVALLGRSRAGVYAGLIAFSPVPIAAALAAWGVLWDPAAFLAALFPLVVLALAYVAGPLGVLPTRLRALAALLPVFVTLWAALEFRVAAGGAGADRARAEESRLAARIQRHVLARSPWAKVFVCGYDGFRLLRSGASPVFAHAMDLNFDRIRTDYEGHALFVLVHRPAGRSAMDSVHWKYPDIYELGAGTTLYDSDWGDWRLFEIVEAPRK